MSVKRKFKKFVKEYLILILVIVKIAKNFYEILK